MGHGTHFQTNLPNLVLKGDDLVSKGIYVEFFNLPNVKLFVVNYPNILCLHLQNVTSFLCFVFAQAFKSYEFHLGIKIIFFKFHPLYK
jgi:hypothetical protein